MSDVKLNYRAEGNGEPLLLVHGFGISFHIWRTLLPLLDPHFTVVMIELPGIGSTPMTRGEEDYLQACVEGIEGVRRSLGIDRWDVLGYSTGSRIAEAYIRADAEHVCRAIFLCPLTIDVLKMRLLRLGVWLDRRIPEFGSGVLSGWRLKFLISWLGFNLQQDPMRDEWYSEIGAVPVEVHKETIRAVASAADGGFSVPVRHAMIWGDRDLVPLTPRSPGEYDYFVHGRHAAPTESAEEIASIVVSFAGETAC